MLSRPLLPPPLTRRELLTRCTNGFGVVALAALLAEDGRAAEPSMAKKPHFPPKAKSVIVLFMDGGPSQVDTFDPKPRLAKEHGKPIPMKVEPTQFNKVGTVLKSPWHFKQHGQSGLWISDLLPNIAAHADKLCVIRSMVADFSEHSNANYFFHTGHGQQGRPSMGAWVTFGLGTESRDLPGFIVLGSGMIPPGGLDCFGSGFLPATYQGSMFKAGPLPVADLTPTGNPAGTAKRRQLLRSLDQGMSERFGKPDAVESAIANYELAYRMQQAVPELMDLRSESKATLDLYGIGTKPTEIFGRQCLIARRLVERGVRFVQLLCPNVGHDRWDQHANLKKGHEENALAVDKPIAGLLQDLQQRGLLKETLVIWGGEFGRTPMAQGSDGRDHNPFGFSIWLAGGGVKGGMTHGETDEFGYHAIRDKVQIHDLHATMLHLLGMDHKKLTFRFGGRDMRLTDVHGEILTPILA